MPSIIGQVKPHVLFVDDDGDFLHLLERAARRSDLFCRITMCSGGEEALTRLSSSLGASEPVQIVVTDFNMPGTKGVELVARIKGIPQTAHIPVAMLTSSDLPEDMVAAREAGVCGFFTKPLHSRSSRESSKASCGPQATVSRRGIHVRNGEGGR